MSSVSSVVRLPVLLPVCLLGGRSLFTCGQLQNVSQTLFPPSFFLILISEHILNLYVAKFIILFFQCFGFMVILGL